MTEESWPTPPSPPGPPAPQAASREPLPRIEDLPIADQGYEQESVRAAFDSFYRHAAQLDASLRTLEAVESFHRHAAALRADLRSLRAAGWTQQSWNATPGYASSTRAPREGISPVVWRIAGYAALLIATAVFLGVAQVSWWLIVVVMAAAWALVALIEWASSRDRYVAPRAAGAPQPVVEAERAPEQPREETWHAPDEAQEPDDAMTMVAPAEGVLTPEPEAAPPPEPEPEPEPEAVPEPVAEAVPEPEPEPEPGDEPEPEPEPEPAQAAAEEPEPVAEEPVEADAEVVEAEPGDEPPRRRWWQRRRQPEDQQPAEAVEPESEPPRHVRVLPAAEADEEQPDPDDAVDPWEQSFDAPSAEVENGAPEEETGEHVAAVAEAEEPARRRFRRR